jgi:NAD(P)H-hydrate epimerase
MSELNGQCAPVLSAAAARDLEARLFAGDEAQEWAAMQAAGRAVAEHALLDFEETGGFPDAGRVLVLVGKGHNGGDALIAARAVLDRHPRARTDIVFVFGSRPLRPLAAKAWRDLAHAGRDRVIVIAADEFTAGPGRSYDLCLDGIFGFQFRPPVETRVRELIESVNACSIRLRAAVDLPSADVFRADFTYATGSVKAPALTSDAAGRIRYLDLGFFRPASPAAEDAPSDFVLTRDVLEPLGALRPGRSDKRSFGHVFLIGGSRGFPGAILMSAMAAIRSGAGLVTAFAPESLAASFAARLPEAIWVGWPETPDGGLALEGEHLLRSRIERANALVVGPGMGREPETLALVQSIVASSEVPVAIDADALQREIVLAGSAPRVVTPHAGEFKRIAGDAGLREFARHPHLTVVLKGPITRVCAGGPIYHSPFGGPVLARGGSGDLLSGMIGTQLAQSPADPLAAAARAVVWHGHAADLLARARGQVAVATTQVLEYLGAALHDARCR